MAISTVLFDLDDTLTDAAQFGAVVLVNAAADHGHALRVDVVQQYPGAPYVPLLQELLGIDQLAATEVYATYVRRYREDMAWGLQPSIGAAELLDALAMREVRLALVTNKLEALAREILALYGWDALFGAVVGQDSYAYRKPHPGIVLHALEALGGALQETAFVGDTPGDMQCASSAGVPTIVGLASTTRAEVLRAAGATHICATLGDVLEVLEA